MQACFNIAGLANIIPIPFFRIQYVNKKHILPLKLKKPPCRKPLFAEREGFEPPLVLPKAVFKTAAINHSAISPGAKVIQFLIRKFFLTILQH